MVLRTRPEHRHQTIGGDGRGRVRAALEGRHAATHHSVNSRWLRVPATKFTKALRGFGDRRSPFRFPSNSHLTIAPGEPSQPSEILMAKSEAGRDLRNSLVAEAPAESATDNLCDPTQDQSRPSTLPTLFDRDVALHEQSPCANRLRTVSMFP